LTITILHSRKQAVTYDVPGEDLARELIGVSIPVRVLGEIPRPIGRLIAGLP